MTFKREAHGEKDITKVNQSNAKRSDDGQARREGQDDDDDDDDAHGDNGGGRKGRWADEFTSHHVAK